MIPEHYQGGCGCGKVRYEVKSEPIIVHCCHCRYCQRQSGAAFAINALFWTEQITLKSGEVNLINTPSPSGKGQTIARCPDCEVAVWSHYFMGGIKEGIKFLRVGTLDNPDLLPPDVHIFTKTKQPWVQYPEAAHIVDVFYDIEATWSEQNNSRFKSLLADLKRN